MPQESITHEAEILDECQKSIDYRFRQPELLRAALTHTSGADTRWLPTNVWSFSATPFSGWWPASSSTCVFPNIRKAI